jgi:hypothetical protein
MFMNAYLIDDDDPILVNARRELAEPIKWKRLFMAGKVRISQRTNTIAKLSKAQRQEYGARLTLYLARAKMAGKRTDGHHGNGYKLAALAQTLTDRKAAAKKRRRTVKRRRALRGLLHHVERSKMLRNAGMPFIRGRVAKRLAEEGKWGQLPGTPKKPDVCAPKSVYNPTS